MDEESAPEDEEEDEEDEDGDTQDLLQDLLEAQKEEADERGETIRKFTVGSCAPYFAVQHETQRSMAVPIVLRRLVRFTGGILDDYLERVLPDICRRIVGTSELITAVMDDAALADAVNAKKADILANSPPRVLVK